MTSIGNDNPIRVLIIDDSVVIRGFISRALADMPGVHIVASVGDGAQGVKAAEREQPDVITLDIEMPVMTGLEAIPHLRKVAPHARIIMSSTLTLDGAEATMKALALGAADYVSKPTSTREQDATTEWKRELSEKVQALGSSAWALRTGSKVTPVKVDTTAPAPAEKTKLYAGTSVVLRPASNQLPEVIAIGSSTGGPQAIFQVLPHLKGLRQPIVLTQHMPKTFTAILAQHITKETGLPAVEAKGGDILQAGHVLVAPGDWHMGFVREGATIKVVLNQNPPENFCRPAVDPMLRSLLEIFPANRILCAILTGMGSDGLKGCQLLTTGGGTVIAQDQPTSVVWGMPGAVATAGLCSAVLPISLLGADIRKRAGGA
jgi:two-component system chemotaxis response regulator CheB